VDKKVLVESDWDAGARLIEALDSKGLEVKAALWLLSPELEEWRLIIATPLIDEQGPIAAYTLVQSVLEATPEAQSIPLDSISIVSPGDPIIKLLGKTFRTGPVITRLGLTKASVRNVFFEEAHIYRMNLQEIPPRTPEDEVSRTTRRKSRRTNLGSSSAPPGGPAPKTR
jgi:hypothetical protein